MRVALTKTWVLDKQNVDRAHRSRWSPRARGEGWGPIVRLYRSPRSPATKRFQPASNLFPGARGPSSAAARGVGKTTRCRARTRDLASLRAALARQEAPGVFLYAYRGGRGMLQPRTALPDHSR